MSDPFASARPGEPSPFLTSAGTVNEALTILRQSRDGLRGSVGGGPLSRAMKNVRWVYAQNILDTTIERFRPAFINGGGPFSVSENRAYTEAEMLTYLDDFVWFAYEPPGAVMGGGGRLGVAMDDVVAGEIGRFAVEGLWACYVSYSTTATNNGWADMTASNNTYLTQSSPATNESYGGARILLRGSNTAAVVELTLVGLGGWSTQLAEKTTTQVFKNGSGTNSTMTITNGLITSIV